MASRRRDKSQIRAAELCSLLMSADDGCEHTLQFERSQSLQRSEHLVSTLRRCAKVVASSSELNATSLECRGALGAGSAVGKLAEPARSAVEWHDDQLGGRRLAEAERAVSERQVSERLLGGCEGERGLVPLQRRLLSEYHVLTRAVLAGHFDVSEHRGEAEAVLSRKKLERLDSVKKVGGGMRCIQDVLIFSMTLTCGRAVGDTRRS